MLLSLQQTGVANIGLGFGDLGGFAVYPMPWCPHLATLSAPPSQVQVRGTGRCAGAALAGDGAVQAVRRHRGELALSRLQHHSLQQVVANLFKKHNVQSSARIFPICIKVILMWRYKEGHCLSHSQETGHCLALSFSDLSVWCYACDNYLDHAKLYPVKGSIMHYQ